MIIAIRDDYDSVVPMPDCFATLAAHGWRKNDYELYFAEAFANALRGPRVGP